MKMKSSLISLLMCIVICCVFSVPGCEVFPQVIPAQEDTSELIVRWNKIATDASALDHTPVGPNENRIFGHQLGPTKSSRALAIVHIAMFDAHNAVVGGYESFTRIETVPPETSAAAAIAQAAHDTLISLFPSHAPDFDALLSIDLSQIPDGPPREAGISLGHESAARILEIRDRDGSELGDNYTVDNAPGAWRPDPMNPSQRPLGASWNLVKPFALNSGSQFRCPAPPAVNSAQYAIAFLEVLTMGGDGVITPTERTKDQSEIGIFWAYDGTAKLGAPPRLYNQIAVQIARENGIEGIELMRLLTLINISMADAGIAIWDSKYLYNYWRPVTGIREAESGTGPSGLGDGNPYTIGDAGYLPLCAPASNLSGTNFTPPFPSYPSGHAGFGAALFQTLRNFFGTDEIPFTFVSDELNGITSDNAGVIRPLSPRSFSTLSAAEEENGQSRIYLGIHWSFDKTEGIKQGRMVANHAWSTVLRPLN